MKEHQSVDQNFITELKKAYKIVRLDEKRIEQVSKDDSATNSALAILAIAILVDIGGVYILLSYLKEMEIYVLDFDITSKNIYTISLSSFAFEIVRIASTALAAKYIFKADLDIYQFFRPVAYANIVKFLNFFPVFSIFTGFWYIYLQYRIMKKLSKLEFWPIVLCILAGVLSVSILGSLMEVLGYDLLLKS